AAWSRQTGDKTGANRIIGRRDHDRDDRCRLLCSDDCWSCRRNNEIDLQSSELGGELCEALSASLRPAVFDRNIAILNPTELAQSLHKSGDPLALNQKRGRSQEADGRQLPRLLCARRQRPRDCSATEQSDELAPLYPNHVIPRACAVWVRLKRTLAALAHFARCLGRLLAVGARHERATVCRFGRLGARCRFLAVDPLSAIVKANRAMASHFVRRFNASYP